MAFNQDEFLKANFTGAAALRALFINSGCTPPGIDAADKWFQRGSLPGGWLGATLALLERQRGAPVSLTAYFCAEPRAQSGRQNELGGVFS